jgi:hypothetical protein
MIAETSAQSMAADVTSSLVSARVSFCAPCTRWIAATATSWSVLSRPSARFYAFTMPTGRSRATTRESPGPSHERTTSDTSLYA